MSYLVFCTAEIGGFPYLISDILNRNGIQTYYISISGKKAGHDTKKYHFGDKTASWDLSDKLKFNSFLPHKFGNIFYSQILFKKRMIALKKEFNFTNCFATGILSFLLKDAGINYIYWSYGSDLDKFCFKLPRPRNYNFLTIFIYDFLFKFKIKKNAKKSIIYAEKTMIAPYQEKYLKCISTKSDHFFLPHVIKSHQDNNIFEKKEKSHNLLTKKYNANYFFFSATRHEWHSNLKDFDDNKGNDILIKAFSLFINQSKRTDIKLILINKGYDVDYTKKIAADLCVEPYIIWLNQMPRHELQEYYLGSTLAFGQFHTPVLTYSALEPLAAATPTFSFFGSFDTTIPFYKTFPPIFNSKDYHSIAHRISELLFNDVLYKQLQQSSLDWIQCNCTEKIFCENFICAFENK